MIYFVPLIGAFFGWIAMQLVVNAFLKPSQITKLAQNLSSSLLPELVTPQFLAGQFKNEAQLKKVLPYIEDHLDKFLQVKLMEKLPYIAGFVGESTFARIKEAIIEEIELLLPNIIAQYTEEMTKETDISRLVASQMQAIPAQKLSTIIAASTRKELSYLKLSGAAIGFSVSLLTLLLTLLA